jgi:hypothetical protein
MNAAIGALIAITAMPQRAIRIAGRRQAFNTLK